MPLPMYQESESGKKKREQPDGQAPPDSTPGSTPDSGGLSQVKAVIGVAAGKGGVGKSVVAVNLALALKKKGHSVGILDGDLYGPSVVKMLPEEKPPGKKGELLTPALASGMPVVSMAYFRPTEEAVAVRAPIANRVLSQFINQVEWGPLDYLIIDFPPGTGDIQLTLAQQIRLTGAILVTTPQEVALLDVQKALHFFHQVQVPVMGVVENMSYYRHKGSEEKVFLFGQGGGRKLASEQGLNFLGEIPVDPELSRCSDAGESIASVAPESASAQAFSTLATSVEREVEGLLYADETRLNTFDLSWGELPLYEEGRKEVPSSDEGMAPVFVRRLMRDGEERLAIEWTDSTALTYSLAELQQQCPCATCRENGVAEKELPVGVKVVRIRSIGQYALALEFSQGCSRGIFSFSMLRTLLGRSAALV
jgi:ATP-binding protein involved in chromosome partitioning